MPSLPPHNSPKTAKIQLLRLEDKEIFDITEGEFADGEPVFDPKGRYLYFISYRDFNPVYGNLFFELSLTRGQLLCLVTLTEDEDDPFVADTRFSDLTCAEDDLFHDDTHGDCANGNNALIDATTAPAFETAL